MDNLWITACGMKPPFKYYGGKQQLASKIIRLIPPHRIYCEPFVGGAAVFFAKPQSEFEILNDMNKLLINFYRVCQNDFEKLQKEILATLQSRHLHRKATVIYRNPDMFSRVKRAWAVWVLANMSFGSKINGGYGYSLDKRQSVRTKRENFTEQYAKRLQDVELECSDAIKVIRSRDSVETFFYVDPPYVGSGQGHYDGYTQEDFDNLLSTLETIKGKFLLSSYRNESLMVAANRNGWRSIEIEMPNNLSAKGEPKKKTKKEVLTANYDIENCEGQKELFSEIAL